MGGLSPVLRLAFLFTDPGSFVAARDTGAYNLRNVFDLFYADDKSGGPRRIRAKSFF